MKKYEAPVMEVIEIEDVVTGNILGSLGDVEELD